MVMKKAFVIIYQYRDMWGKEQERVEGIALTEEARDKTLKEKQMLCPKGGWYTTEEVEVVD